MAIPNIDDLTGTSSTTFQIGIPQISTPVVLKNVTGSLELTNLAGTADVSLTALSLNLSATSDQIVLNSAATGSGSSWTSTLSNAASGQTSALTLRLPPNAGTAGQVLTTDGNNPANLSWSTVLSGAAFDTKVSHTVLFSDTSPYTYLSLPIGAIISQIAVIVDTAFDGTGAALSVGVSGTPSKFMIAGASDLTTIGRYATSSVEAVAPSGSAQTILLTFNGGTGSTAGSCRVITTYAVPTAV